MTRLVGNVGGEDVVNAGVMEGAAASLASSRARSRQVLRQVAENDLQGIVDLLRTVCEVEIAWVGVLDDASFHCLVVAGSEPLPNDVELAMCQFPMHAPGVVVISDTSSDERTQDNPCVNGTLMALRSYASAPIHAPDGAVVGRLCLFDNRPRELTPVQEAALVTLGDVVGTILRLRVDPPEPEAPPPSPDLEMAARVSHDLRVPLAALTASLELLADATKESGDRTVALLITSARRSLDRMSGLVDGLLRMHELTAEPRRTEVDLDRVASWVCADLAPLIEGAGATVQVEALPTVAADPDLMYSVLLNLVSNAVKFVRPGVAPVVTLHSRRIDGGWRVSVVDNGAGIPEHQRAAVFGMFTRLTNAPGHGIGLTTVAQIVRAHGGLAGVDDADGPGSEFWFELPDA